MEKLKMNRFLIILILLFLSACATTNQHRNSTWVLNKEFSKVSIITTKNNKISEVSEFKSITGKIINNSLEISIDLNSLETNIAIRNERIRNILFETSSFPTADIHAQLKAEDLNQGVHTITFDIDLHGVSAIIEAEFLVTEYYSNKIIMLHKPLIIKADMFGLEQGISTLKDIAHLQSINFTVPVDITLEFQQK